MKILLFSELNHYLNVNNNFPITNTLAVQEARALRHVAVCASIRAMSSVGDIEDCVVRSDPLPSERGSARARVLPRALRASRKRAAARACGDEAEVERPVAESFIPGTQPVYVKTWGCSHNNSDGEYMAGILAASGYPITCECALTGVTEP